MADDQDDPKTGDLSATMPELRRSVSISLKKGGSRKTIRTVSPLGMRVLVRVRPESNISEGGLYLPEGVKEQLHESILGEVVEVASAIDMDSDEETNVSGVPLGSLVLIPKRAGVKVPWDDDLRLVDTKEVLAIVTEVEIS